MVGESELAEVGISDVGPTYGDNDGTLVGSEEGSMVGFVGMAVGSIVGDVGICDGLVVDGF